MKRVLVVDVSVRVIFHTTLIGSLYLLFVGHNQPGGGFVGGLVAGGAIALRFIAGGLDEVRGLTRLKPWTILGTGILLAGITAVVPLLFGDPVMSSALWEADVPVLGKVKTTSALFFDSGVYILVVGMIFMVFEAFGGEPPDAERGAPRSPDLAGEEDM